jgi:hypothetical protein
MVRGQYPAKNAWLFWHHIIFIGLHIAGDTIHMRVDTLSFSL